MLNQALGAAAGAGAGGFLGRLGDTLDAPRQALYNLAAKGKKLASGEGDWSDLLGALPGAAGAALAGGLMATGVGAPLGILAGSALGGLGQLAGKATGQRTFDAPTTDDLASSLGVDTDSTAGKVASLGLGALTDPLTYAGGLGGARLTGTAERASAGSGRLSALVASDRAAHGLPAALGAAEPATTRLEGLMANRRGFTMVKGFNPETMDLGKVIGNAADESQFLPAATDMAAAGPGVRGEYRPDLRTAVSTDRAGGLVRHEMIHGLIDQAARSGQTAHLPLMMRLPAQLQGSGNSLVRGLGSVADELAAQTLEHRGLLGQLQGASQFLFENPLSQRSRMMRAAYAGEFAHDSPTVGALYRGLGYAPYGAAAGAGVGGALLTSRGD